MNPLMIIAMIQAALPLLEQFVAMGVQIAQAIKAAQGTPAAPHLAELSTAHAAMGTAAVDAVKAMAAAVTK
jgi:hypothetical protein